MFPVTKRYNLEFHDIELTFSDLGVRMDLLDKSGQQVYAQEFGRREFFQFFLALSRFAEDMNNAILASKPKH